MRVLDSALPATASTPAAAPPGYSYRDDDARTVRAAHGEAMEMIQATASE